MRLKIIAVCLCLFLSGAAYATDRHVGSGQTYANINAALSAASGGDTIIVHDGTYTDSITTVPAGTAGAYTVIKALNDGGVNITGTLFLPVSTSAYLQFEGLKWTKSEQKTIAGHHLKFFRCAFSGGDTAAEGAGVAIGDVDTNATITKYVLFEDCWSYGIGGRYNFVVYLSDHIVFRRCIARHDGGYGPYSGNPEAGFSNYNSQYVEFQNCMVIDSNLQTTNNPGSVSGYAYWDQAFYLIYNSTCPLADCESTDHLYIRSNISLNNLGSSYRFDGSSTTITIPIWTNNVGIGFGEGGDVGAIINGGSGTLSFGSTLLNCAYKNFTYGAADGHGSAGTIDYSFMISLGTAYYNFTDGGHNLTSAGTAWTYIPRIESGSVGPTILKKIGVSGTLYGDTGYADTTTDNLWPWPNEDRIKTDMAAVSNRGFTAYSGKDGTHNSLTSYIWEYLGNQIPADIYGGGADTTAPETTISTSSPQSISSDSLAVSGTASDAVGVSGVKWRIGAEPDATHGTACTGTTSWSATVTGFSSGANTLYIEAYDAAENYDSGNSITVNYSIPSSAMLSGATMSGGRIN
jgi:hypothetical protein